MHFTYHGQFEPMHAIELYAKTMTNMGPVNCLYLKCIHYRPVFGREPGLGSFSFVDYLRPLEAYVAHHLMQCGNQKAEKLEMERSFFGLSKRMISLENQEDNTLKVEVEGSARGISRVRKTLDMLFHENPSTV